MKSEHTDYAWVRAWLIPAFVVASGLAVAIWLLDLIPPTQITFAAGRQGGAYHAMAERYREILARDGIDMTILDTAGSVQNVALLESGEADAAFLQGGVDPSPDAEINALAATFLEPFWIFHGGLLSDPANPSQWRGLRIAGGEPGSGTRFAVDAVLSALSLDPGAIELFPLAGVAAAEALLADDIDVALFVAPVDAPYLQPLLESRAEVISGIRDGEALSRQLPFVQLAVIPPAGLDYAERIPPEQIDLIAMVGRLAARDDLHPALVDRLVNAAREVHSGRGLLQDENEFPSVKGASIPMNEQATSLIEKGPNPFSRFLPHWIVAQISKFALLLVPIFFLLLPLIRLGPSVYQWQMQSRVYRHYGELLRIEREALSENDPARLAALSRKLETIEADLLRLRLPMRFRENAYTTRMHINLVQSKIAERRKDR